MKLYEACLTLLQVYSKNNQSRKRSDAAAEEDQYQDLLLIMELLTNLLSKEFIDFSDTGAFTYQKTSVLPSLPPTGFCSHLFYLWRFRRGVQEPGPGDAGLQQDGVGSRRGSLWRQHRSSSHVSGPAQGKNLNQLGWFVLLSSVCVVFSALTLILSSSVQFPSLCNQYYKLITFICEIFPEKIPQLPEDLFKSLMFSLELGMTSYPLI